MINFIQKLRTIKQFFYCLLENKDDELIIKLAQIITCSTNPEELKNKTVKEIAISLDACRCFFIEYDAHTNNFKKIVNSYNSKVDDLSMLGFDIEKDLPSFAIKQKYLKHTVVQDTERFIKEHKLEGSKEDEYYKKYNVKAYLTIRLEFSENLLGIIVIQYDTKKLFLQNIHVSYLEHIAEHISIALYLSTLYVNEKADNEKERLLRSIISMMSESFNLNQVIQKILEILGKIYDAESVYINIDIENYKNAYFYNSPESEFKNNENGNKDSLVDTSIYESLDFDQIKNKTHYISDTHNFVIQNNLENSSIEKYFYENNVKSLILLPILYENLSFGLLIVHFSKPNPITRDNLEFIRTVTNQLAIAIKQYQSYEKQRRTAEIEKISREIIIYCRNLDNYDDFFNYILQKLSEIFDSDIALHLYCSKTYDIIVKNEFTKNAQSEFVVDQTIFNYDQIKEIKLGFSDNIISINDTEEEIKDGDLKNYCKKNDIRAFLMYPIAQKVQKNEESDVSFILIGYAIPKKWTNEEINTFKLLIDTTSVIYLEIKQRKETDEIRQTFLAALTHDLRSPINAEQKALEVIISGRVGKSLNDFSEYLEDIYKTNDELLRIVNNILSVYHMESGQYKLNLESNDIKEIVYDVVNTMNPLAKDKESEIVVHIEPDIPLVMIDGTEINRVISNLISNAIKHNSKGTEILVNVKRANNEVFISIQDNGKGIPEEERGKIFQRYPTTKRKIGTGLGLYLSKQIIDAHHGRMWFETEVNKGTTFYFTIPIEDSIH